MPAPGWGGHDQAPPAGPQSERGGSAGRRALVVAVVVALLAAGGGFVAGRLTDDQKPSQVLGTAPPAGVTPTTTAQTQPPPLKGNEAEPAEAVARVLRPAVVQLRTSDGLGSGVIYDKSGLILTAAHVVGSAKSVRVQQADGTVSRGEVVGADGRLDVAVVRMPQGAHVTTATLGRSANVAVGQTAIAVGSPFGLNQSVTEGIISAVDRSVPTTGSNEVPMLQTDAPINPGNSGGALADRRGSVIGINDAIYSGSGSGVGSEPGNVGVGFAIPIDLAKRTADLLVAGKSIPPAFLGVEVGQASGNRAGALVVTVTNGSPADKAGLSKGDVVVSVDGKPIQSNDDLVAAVRTRQPGDRIVVVYLRDGQQRQATVTLGQK